MRHDIHIFCFCVVGVTWKWLCNRPWGCLTLKAAFQEGRIAHNWRRKGHLGGTSNRQQTKSLLWQNKKTPLTHLLFPILSRSSYLVLPPRSSSIWPFRSLATQPYHGSYSALTSMGDSSLPDHLVYKRLRCADIWVPFQKDFTPSTRIEHLFTVGSANNFPVATLLVEQLWDIGQESPLFISVSRTQTKQQMTNWESVKDVPQFCFLTHCLKIYPPWKSSGLHFCSHWSSNAGWHQFLRRNSHPYWKPRSKNHGGFLKCEGERAQRLCHSHTDSANALLVS